ncbi:MAG: TdeIII family type II restriction endonuclease, partial [candidate division WOR-3 bacterium]
VAEILARDKGYKVRRQVDVVNGELRGCKEQGEGKRFIYKKMRDFKEFKALKRKILTWQAIRLTGDIERTPLGIVAIPYNPYHPEPYNRWTLKGLYDIENDEILIAEEFWDFVAGERVFDKLLKVFEEAGRVIKPKIDEFLKKFNKP